MFAYLYRPHGIVMAEFRNDLNKYLNKYGGRTFIVEDDFGKKVFMFGISSVNGGGDCQRFKSKDAIIEEIQKEFPGYSIVEA